jgi:hypothetical protein
MRHITAVVFLSVLTALAATIVGSWLIQDSDAHAQAPSRPCTCSQGTELVGTNEPTPRPGVIYDRGWIFSCRCGPLKCVSQLTSRDSHILCLK